MPTQIIIDHLAWHCEDARSGDRVFIPIAASDQVIEQVREQLREAFPGVWIVLFRPNKAI